MIKTPNIIVKSSYHNKPILTDVFYTKNNIKKPVVIFCHGYKGYKDWGAWNLAANEFVKNNLFFVKFNFSHNGGTVENPIDFPDLEAFGQNNFIIELNDLENIIEWLITNADYKNEIDINNITLIGHSRGGGIVTLKASENKHISKVISWSGVSDFEARFPKGEVLEFWEKAGVSFIENTRTKQKMPHYFQFYKSFKEHIERLTIKRAASTIKIPHLIIQGEDDAVVLPDEAKNLHAWNPKSELIIIPEMNHPLGCTQPWESDKMPIHLEEVVNLSVAFVLRHT
ncbi:alpha/beta hydrolase family protein [Lutibacter oceani]|uniref:Alpha/beta hydrolase family protein n=1 Tax=Lutibacter oceani TaxID=1853311 RepID=A0A3D9RUB7_9FLAO|nr:alpha/beta hydrolase [Lutibacter oceani]REE83553.1 alpha/beta hydrolase family protein [Lutibacter oceani]